MNMRQTLGEAVPTVIFRKIANKILRVLCKPTLTEVEEKDII